MRTAVALRVLECAREVVIAYRVLDEHDAGRSVDPMRLQWAQSILLANAPEPDHQSRAQAPA